MAWIDSNGLYHGTWDYTEHGCAIRDWNNIKAALIAADAGGRLPALPRRRPEDPVLRERLDQPPGPASSAASCAPRWPKAARRVRAGPVPRPQGRSQRQRIHLLWNGYAHAVQPPEAFPKRPIVPHDPSGEPVVSFASTDDPHYQAMLAIIRDGREQALADPRVDMPGAEVIAGACRQFHPPPLPAVAPPLIAAADAEGVVQLAWERSARTIGLEAEVHRSGTPDFAPDASTLLTRTPLSQYADRQAPLGPQHYALVLVQGTQRSKPAYASVTVPEPPPPPAPEDLKAASGSCSIRLSWRAPPVSVLGYQVYRCPPGVTEFQLVTATPVRQTRFSDAGVESGKPYRYVVRAVSQRGVEGPPTPAAEATATVVTEPVFAAAFDAGPAATLGGGQTLAGKLHGPAACSSGVLDLRSGGHVTFPHQEAFDLAQPLSVNAGCGLTSRAECRWWSAAASWNQAGWFLQRLGGTWRWHVGGVDCDGGLPAVGRWIHLAAVYDGQSLKLYQDGEPVAERPGSINASPWTGELHIGQYSGQPSADYQVTGRMTGVRLYHRPLDAKEVAAEAKQVPAT